MRRTLRIFMAALALGGARARADEAGWLGQSQPIPEPPIAWCACEWIQDDPAGNVYLPDGWKVPAGSTRAVKMTTTLPGRLYCDGEQLYVWQPTTGWLRRVKALPDGGLADAGAWCRLPDWRYQFFFVPTVQTNGYAGRYRALVLHQEAKTVCGITPDGTWSPPLHICQTKERDTLRSVALHPETGDLLLGFTWPTCLIRRYRPDGTAVQNAKWPYRVRADVMKIAGGKLWALGGNAQLVDESGIQTQCGQYANVTRDLARTQDGIWLATTQGAQYYPLADSTGRCAVRLGGLPDLSAIGLLNGRVLAAAGPRLFALWLDDLPDEPLHSDERWLVCPDRYDGRATAIEGRQNLFFIQDGGTGKTWAFDPEQTQWLLRHKRQYETNITIRTSHPLQAHAQGWTIRYDPIRKGIYRSRAD